MHEIGLGLLAVTTAGLKLSMTTMHGHDFTWDFLFPTNASR